MNKQPPTVFFFTALAAFAPTMPLAAFPFEWGEGETMPWRVFSPTPEPTPSLIFTLGWEEPQIEVFTSSNIAGGFPTRDDNPTPPPLNGGIGGGPVDDDDPSILIDPSEVPDRGIPLDGAAVAGATGDDDAFLSDPATPAPEVLPNSGTIGPPSGEEEEVQPPILIDPVSPDQPQLASKATEPDAGDTGQQTPLTGDFYEENQEPVILRDLPTAPVFAETPTPTAQREEVVERESQDGNALQEVRPSTHTVEEAVPIYRAPQPYQVYDDPSGAGPNPHDQGTKNENPGGVDSDNSIWWIVGVVGGALVLTVFLWWWWASNHTSRKSTQKANTHGKGDVEEGKVGGLPERLTIGDGDAPPLPLASKISSGFDKVQLSIASPPIVSRNTSHTAGLPWSDTMRRMGSQISEAVRDTIKRVSSLPATTVEPQHSSALPPKIQISCPLSANLEEKSALKSDTLTAPDISDDDFSDHEGGLLSGRANRQATGRMVNVPLR